MTGANLFETFGCRLNAYETEAMTRLAEDAGVENAIVVNSCAVTAEAVRRSRQRIRRLRRDNPGRKLIITGCAAQTDPDMYAKMPEVDQVLGNAEKLTPEIWREIGKDEGRLPGSSRVRVGDIMECRSTAAGLVDGLGTRSRAYVQIQNGCDHRCTFCIIPFGRGNSRSVPEDFVVNQVAHLVDRGYGEVVLTGVDLTAWGMDLPGKPRLGDLVGNLLDRNPELQRLRLSSLDSVEVDSVLLDVIESEPRLMPHLHLSLQSGDNLILKRMKRRHSREDAVRFCADVRDRRPDVVFGADIIAGFPTEDQGMFENSVSLLEECGLTWLHVFPFSARPGTPAARMPQNTGEVINSRARQLRQVAKSRIGMYLESQVGRHQAVLMESARTGRTGGFAEVRLDSDAAPGTIIQAAVMGVDGHRLNAHIIQ